MSEFQSHLISLVTGQSGVLDVTLETSPPAVVQNRGMCRVRPHRPDSRQHFSSPPERTVATTHLCIYCQYVLQGQAGRVGEGRGISFEKMLNTKPGICVDEEDVETKREEETPKKNKKKT